MGNFTGKKIDRDTGLYYFNARWYDPQLGRFVTEDPIKDGVNFYAYANNNPLRYVDPTGLRFVIGEHVETGELVTEDEYEAPKVEAVIYRNEESYQSKAGDPDSQGKDFARFSATNVLGETSVQHVGDLQTVDIYKTRDKSGVNRNQPYTDPKYGEIQGNTIAPGELDLFYESTSTIAKNPVLIIANTETISGKKIGPDGHPVTGEEAGGRFLFHDNYDMRESNTNGSDYNNQKSDGCFIPPTSEMVQLLDFLRAWVPENSNIPSTLYEGSPY